MQISSHAPVQHPYVNLAERLQQLATKKCCEENWTIFKLDPKACNTMQQSGQTCTLTLFSTMLQHITMKYYARLAGSLVSAVFRQLFCNPRNSYTPVLASGHDLVREKNRKQKKSRFRRQLETGSEMFSRFPCLEATTIVLLKVLSVKETS